MGLRPFFMPLFTQVSSYEVTALRLRVAVGRRQGIRPTSHLQGTLLRAHVEGGSGRSEASPTAILQDTHSVEGLFCDVRRHGVLQKFGFDA
jgi:hypothetical protein